MAKILLVEDNEMNRDMLSRRLERRGYQVVMAEDGAVGVAMSKSEAPDIILMDMSLPIVDGWEATRQIKASPETQGIPVIALTAHAMAGDEEKAAVLGLDAYVPDLQKIHTAGSQLLTLINETISPSRLEAGKIELQPLQRNSRTLLDLILGYNEMCQEDAAEQNHASFIADLKKIHKAAKTLLGLLNDAEFLKPLTADARKPRPAAMPDPGGRMVKSGRAREDSP